MTAILDTTRVCGINTELRVIGEGRPVVYLHSGDGIKRELDFVHGLSHLGRIHAPSHPGFGNSDRPDDFKTVEDLAYFYLDLLDQHKLDDITLIGASFGGWIASEMAVRSTRRIRDLVLIDTVGARFSDRDVVDIADIYMLPDEEFRSRAFVDPAKGKIDIANSSDDDLIEVSRNRIALCQYAWSPYMHNPRLRRWLHRIDVPTLLVWGASDEIVTVDYGRKFAAEIPRARLEVVEQAGHFPHIEQGKRVMQLIESFVAPATVAAE